MSFHKQNNPCKLHLYGDFMISHEASQRRLSRMVKMNCTLFQISVKKKNMLGNFFSPETALDPSYYIQVSVHLSWL